MTQHFSYRAPLNTTNVVKFQNNRVGFTTINARMGFEVCEKLFFCLLGILKIIFSYVSYMIAAIELVVLLRHQIAACSACSLIAISASFIFVKLANGFTILAARTSFNGASERIQTVIPALKERSSVIDLRRHDTRLLKHGQIKSHDDFSGSPCGCCPRFSAVKTR